MEQLPQKKQNATLDIQKVTRFPNYQNDQWIIELQRLGKSRRRDGTNNDMRVGDMKFRYVKKPVIGELLVVHNSHIRQTVIVYPEDIKLYIELSDKAYRGILSELQFLKRIRL